MRSAVLLLFLVVPAVLRAFEAHDDNLDAPPLSPQEQFAKFHLPPGFEIQLVAAEDQIPKPLNINFDGAGRLWVTGTGIYPWAARTDALGEPIPGFYQTWGEMMGYFNVPPGSALATPPEHGQDSVRVLSDFGPDGHARKVQVFAGGLNIPVGVQPLPLEPGAKGDSVIVHSIPSIWKLTDTDGDGVADRRERLYTGFGFKDTHGMSSNYQLSYDGWIYCCHGFANHSEVRDRAGNVTVVDSGNTCRFRPDGSRFEIYSHGQTNPFGLTEDDHGDFYTCDSHSRPAMLVLPGGYYEGIGKQDDGLGFAPRIMEHDHGSSAIAGIAWYGADQFPAEYRGNTFNGNPVTRRINRDRYEWHGSSPTAVEMPDFLTCDDPWFRPVQVKLGPDGALYIADFYNSIIGHYEMPLIDPRRDRSHGRIWRIVWKGEKQDAPVASLPDLTILRQGDLLAKLDDSNITVRRLAVNELAARSSASDVAALKAASTDSSRSALSRTLAAFALASLVGDVPAPDTASTDFASAALALRFLGEKPSWNDDDRAVAARALKSGDPRVRRAAASAIERHPEGMLADLLAAVPLDRKDADFQLVYSLSVAIREALKSPGGYAEAKAAMASSPFGRDYSQITADTSLAIASEDSGRALLDHMIHAYMEGSNGGKHLQKAVQNLPESRLGELSELLPILAKLHEERQAAIAATLSQTLSAKGGNAMKSISPDLTAWLHQCLLVGLHSTYEQTIPSALAAIGDLHDESFRPELSAMIRDAARPAAVRIAALQALAGLPNAFDDFRSALLQTNAPSLRLASAVALRNLHHGPHTRAILLEALPAAAGELATELACGLTEDDESAVALLDLVEQGKAAPALLRQRAVAANLANRSQEIKDRTAALTRDLPPEDARLDQVIAARARAYDGLATHDRDHGAQIFTANCSACHRLHGQGGVVGPNLDGIRSRGTQRLIEDVLDPNRNVDPLFRVVLMETTDGSLISGMNLREEGGVLHYTDAAGSPQQIASSRIRTRTRSAASSPMPAGFENVLPEKDFYDLISYLLAE